MQLEIIPNKPVNNDPRFNTPDCIRLLEMYSNFYPKSGFNPPWVGYVLIRDDVIVGTCGFTGTPKNNTVEIAYWTFETHEGQGVASFACGELVKIARQEISDLTIIAHTAPEHNASTHILEKNGFIKTGIERDDEIGEAWKWQLAMNN